MSTPKYNIGDVVTIDEIVELELELMREAEVTK